MQRDTLNLILLALGLSACQSKYRALVIFCTAPLECTECMAAPSEADQQELLGEYVGDRVRNREVIELFGHLVTLDPETQDQTLQSTLQSEGIESCPSVDLKP